MVKTIIFTFLLPSGQSAQCAVNPRPTQLLELRVSIPGQSDQTFPAIAREGDYMTIPVVTQTENAPVTFTPVDTDGRLGCQRVWTQNGTLNVPRTERVNEQWYDVVGRRLPSRPSTPGVYFLRVENGVKKIVVVR